MSFQTLTVQKNERGYQPRSFCVLNFFVLSYSPAMKPGPVLRYSLVVQTVSVDMLTLLFLQFKVFITIF